jgi:ribosomal protein S12 methylthiotransferase
MELQESNSMDINKSKIGSTLRVLVDAKEGDHFTGRTEFDSPEVDNEVLIRTPYNKIIPGRFYDLRITGAGPYDLIAE